MKSLDEKRRIARMARNIGMPDLALEEEIQREEHLAKTLFVEDKVFTPPQQAPVQHLEPIEQIAKSMPHVKVEEKRPITENMRDAELQGIRKQINELVQKLGTLSWGGGGTGVVRFRDLDDHNRPSDVSWLEFNTAGPPVPPPSGSIAWNPVEECMDVHQPDGTICQVGLENYIRVYNDTLSTMTAGMFVQFSGVHEPEDHTEEHAPTVVGFSAGNGNPPLYTVGVLTEDIAPGNYGRATCLGKVRHINTTGSAVSETWQKGDLLWAHPTIPGALTKVQPTAPYVVVSVAVVLHAGVDGEILVRPAIFPRLHYGNFSSNTEQTAAQTNTPYAVVYDTNGTTCGHVVLDNINKSNVICQHQGLYNFDFKLQATSSNASRSNIWIWARVNGVDIQRSASKLTIESNGGEIAPSWSFRLPMNANDVFQLMWATDSTSVKLSAPTGTAFAPSTPSALLQVTQVNL
jgi:hypothetical protein